MRPILILAMLLFSAASMAQTTIFKEDFNNCALTPGWDVSINGNQDAIWYVSNSITNDDQNGASMNGSCFLFIDDDANGDNTPAFVMDILSPSFDLSQFTTAQLSLDVHYRDWYDGQESFKVFLVDGPEEIELASFAQFQSTGDSLFEYKTLKFDLTLTSLSNSARLLFRYDDAGAYNWWVGIDNVEIIGSGDGTNVIAEGFNRCVKPTGWQTNILTGDADWTFGKATNPNAASGPSMDGSCFAFFDDDLLGAAAPFSNVLLQSPWFDGTQYGTFTLDFDIILRYYSEIMRLYVEHGNGDIFLLGEAADDIGGPLFNNFQHFTFDISAYRSQQMRIVFEYDDGDDFAWWAGVDNIKVVGKGAANDLCVNATEILTGNDCKLANTFTAVFDGPAVACGGKGVASLWYKWQADFSGLALFTTDANFNDAVEVFTGDCTTPVPLVCNNRDEHGFKGERTYFNAVSGQSYLIRVSGISSDFGVSRGNVCTRLDPATTTPAAPSNDQCSAAITLPTDGACVASNNRNADMSQAIPSLNELARADVWYQFTAPVLAANEVLDIHSNADFSDIITVYSGNCTSLIEVAGNHKGARLELNSLNAGQVYYVQIAGNFASVEGDLCPQVSKKQINAPSNDQCVDATLINLGSACQSASNEFASFSGKIPPCVPEINKDVWFKFVAGSAGSVRILSEAGFQHVLALWEGTCADLTPVFCAKNPLACDGFLQVGNLVPGKTYWVQAASWVSSAGANAGSICIKIIDGAAPPDFEPLFLEVETDCNSLTTAVLKLDISGGVAPVQIEGAQDAQVLNSGESYFLVVTDARGCVQMASGVVPDCANSGCTVAAALAKTEPACFNNQNGVLNAEVVGGTPPYAYSWSNGHNTAINQGLGAGNYSLTVTDALGCDVVLFDTLRNPELLTAAALEIIQPTVGENNGSISMNIQGGTGAYSYVWQRNGALFSNLEDINFAPPGNYTLTVTDENGCTTVFQTTLTETVSATYQQSDWFAEVFPNPAREKATLAVSFEQATTLQLSIVDGAGRTLKNWTVEQVQEQNIALDIKDLPSGAYRVRIQSGARSMDRKLVVSQ